MRNHIVAIIFPEPDELKAFCLVRGLSGTTVAEQIVHPEVFKAIESDLSRLAKDSNFNSLEKVKGNFELVDKEFEVGVVLTPTMKIKRKDARDLYADAIAKIYKRADALIDV
jgi:long-chain acyl-CoA synthetase